MIGRVVISRDHSAGDKQTTWKLEIDGQVVSTGHSDPAAANRAWSQMLRDEVRRHEAILDIQDAGEPIEFEDGFDHES